MSKITMTSKWEGFIGIYQTHANFFCFNIFDKKLLNLFIKVMFDCVQIYDVRVGLEFA